MALKNDLVESELICSLYGPYQSILLYDKEQEIYHPSRGMCFKPIHNSVTKTKIFENNIILVITLIREKESPQGQKSLEK